MALKYKFSQLFSGRFPKPKQLYEELESLDDKIENGADAVPVVKNDVKLTKTSLKKAFGDAKKFKNIGVVHNEEGSYIIVADEDKFKYLPLEDI